MVDINTKSEEILETFQNRVFATSEWENVADQVLKRGLQKVADELQ